MAQTIIFFGPQGSGKGTQSKTCVSFLEENGKDVINISTGEEFRKLGNEGGAVGEKVKSLLEEGEMLPVFFPVWLWTSILIEKQYTGEQSIVIDGSPRTVDELNVFNAATDFYNWQPIVLSLLLSEEEVYRRIKARGRSDDSDAGIERRLSWYREYTAPILDQMKHDSRYVVHDIDAARSVEEIFTDIKNILQ